MDYKEEKFVKVRVCGIECDFSDMRIDRTTVVHGKYQYEIAGDDDRGDEPVRIFRNGCLQEQQCFNGSN